jgi:dTDP-4-amino-4,6-dideoxygalactose transaminase
MRVTLHSRLRSGPGRVVCYGNASHGLYDVLAWLERRDGHGVAGNGGRRGRPNVLLPAYLPAKLYRTALAAGFTPRFYDLDAGCRFDPAELETLLDEGTRAILVIHYFGLPTRLDEVRRIATARGLWLIEDCALTLPARVGGTALGRLGDCALFSPRKMLLFPEGGMLSLNRPAEGFRPSYRERVRSSHTAWNLVKTRGKRLYLTVTGGRDPLGLVRCPVTGYIDLGEVQRVRVKGMSRLTRALSRIVDVELVAARRRAHYTELLAGIRDMPGLEPLRPDLPEGCTPYSLPLRVAEGQRDRVREHLLRLAGVGCGAGWPESPFGRPLAGTTDLAARVLELPVHHLLGRSQPARILDALQTLTGASRWT